MDIGGEIRTTGTLYLYLSPFGEPFRQGVRDLLDLFVISGHAPLGEHLKGDAGHGGYPGPGAAGILPGVGVSQGHGGGYQDHISGFHGLGDRLRRLLAVVGAGGHPHHNDLLREPPGRFFNPFGHIQLVVIGDNEHCLILFYPKAGGEGILQVPHDRRFIQEYLRLWTSQ